MSARRSRRGTVTTHRHRQGIARRDRRAAAGKVGGMAWLIPERYAAELDAETARLAAAVTERPDDARIPSCPEWTVRDLVTHVGTGHRLGARIIEEKRDSPAPYVLVDAPTDQAEW